MVKEIYDVSDNFPSEEKFGLISQMRRSSISIASNIAEGSGKESNKEFIRFLEIAYSSAFELETQIILSHDLNFISDDDEISLLKKIREIQKMIFTFVISLKSKNNSLLNLNLVAVPLFL
ncbi:MAG: four helix bundle protein [Ignavibacteria bacterium]|nr:four helix bundle protein [Ignavibacteria bacterium]